MKHSKKLAALLSVLITISSTNIYSQSEWVLKSTGLNLNALHFNDDMTGWVVGDSGTILATLDGGSNWLCVSSETSQSLKAYFS